MPGDFQGFEDELRGLPGRYAGPAGAMGLAWAADGKTAGGEAAGAVALRPLSPLAAQQAACEAKRLYVRPQYRRHGLGHALVEWITGQARARGYRAICCDTLLTMAGPIRLYKQLGFRILDGPYAETPTPGAVYLMKQL